MIGNTYYEFTCYIRFREYEFRNIYTTFNYFVPYNIEVFYNQVYEVNINAFYDIIPYKTHSISCFFHSVKEIARHTINCFTVGEGGVLINCFFLPNVKHTANILPVIFPLTYTNDINSFFERGYIHHVLCSYALERIRNINCYIQINQVNNITNTRLSFDYKGIYDLNVYVNTGDYYQIQCSFAKLIQFNIARCFLQLNESNVVNTSNILLSITHNRDIPCFVFHKQPTYDIYCEVLTNTYDYSIPVSVLHINTKHRDVNSFIAIKETNIINYIDIIKANKFPFIHILAYYESKTNIREITCYVETRMKHKYVKIAMRSNISFLPVFNVNARFKTTISKYITGTLDFSDIESVSGGKILSVVSNENRGIKIILDRVGLHRVGIFTQRGEILRDVGSDVVYKLVKSFVSSFEILEISE
ncbi:MAG: hypothetical protein QXX12_07150 [Nanopusillaceae archaeon]